MSFGEDIPILRDSEAFFNFEFMGSCFSVKIKAESPLHDGMLACCFSTYLTSNSFTCSLLRSCGFWLLKHAIQHLYPAFFFEWFLISFIGMDLCFGFSVAEHWCFVWFSIWINMKIFVLFDWFMNLNSKSLCNCWLKKRKKKNLCNSLLSKLHCWLDSGEATIVFSE